MAGSFTPKKSLFQLFLDGGFEALQSELFRQANILVDRAEQKVRGLENIIRDINRDLEHVQQVASDFAERARTAEARAMQPFVDNMRLCTRAIFQVVPYSKIPVITDEYHEIKPSALNNDVANLTTDVRMLKRRVEIDTVEILDLRKDLGKRDTENKTLHEEIRLLKSIVDSGEAQAKELRSERTFLQRTVAKNEQALLEATANYEIIFNARQYDIANMQRSITSMQKTVDSQQKGIENLSATNEFVKRQRDECQGILHTRKRQIAALRILVDRSYPTGVSLAALDKPETFLTEEQQNG